MVCIRNTFWQNFFKTWFFFFLEMKQDFFNLSVLKLILYREDVWLLFTMQAVDLTHSHELIPPLRLRQTRKVWVCACTCIVCTQNIQYSSCVWVSVSVLQGATWLIPNKQDLSHCKRVTDCHLFGQSEHIDKVCVCDQCGDYWITHTTCYTHILDRLCAHTWHVCSHIHQCSWIMYVHTFMLVHLHFKQTCIHLGQGSFTDFEPCQFFLICCFKCSFLRIDQEM